MSWNNNTRTIRELTQRLPANTCPSIDGLIRELNELRASNADLRDIAEEALQLADKLEDERQDLEAQVDKLQSRIDELESHVCEVPK
jgi:predicted nuclease with TOPRIM domain